VTYDSFFKKTNWFFKKTNRIKNQGKYVIFFFGFLKKPVNVFFNSIGFYKKPMILRIKNQIIYYLDFPEKPTNKKPTIII